MLTYILWHWPFPEVNSQDYETGLAEFHKSLNATEIQGFKQSVVFRDRGATWTGAEDRGYEDWYILEGSAAMDVLNEAAVSEARKLAHDNVAHAAGGAIAGLYNLQQGQVAIESCRFAFWLTKPKGTGYEEFYQLVRPWTERPGVSLWRRQMVLGPTPEFGLFTPERLSLPSNLQSAEVELEPVWP